jgi:hypothetical protein
MIGAGQWYRVTPHQSAITACCCPIRTTDYATVVHLRNPVHVLFQRWLQNSEASRTRYLGG